MAANRNVDEHIRHYSHSIISSSSPEYNVVFNHTMYVRQGINDRYAGHLMQSKKVLLQMGIYH